MNYKYIIWDWNGTLFDDVIISLDSVNEMLSKRNMPPLPISRYLEYNGTPIIHFYERVFDLNKFPFETIIDEFRENYDKRIEKAALGRGIPEALENFKKSGATQLIISAAMTKDIELHTKRLGIRDYFSDIIGSENTLGGSKLERAKRYFENIEINPGNAVVFGDTDHDGEMAETIGADCVLIASGHQSKKALLGCGVKVIDSACEIENLMYISNK